MKNNKKYIGVVLFIASFLFVTIGLHYSAMLLGIDYIMMIVSMVLNFNIAKATDDKIVSLIAILNILFVIIFTIVISVLIVLLNSVTDVSNCRWCET